jgi:hypothetical protein
MKIRVALLCALCSVVLFSYVNIGLADEKPVTIRIGLQTDNVKIGDDISLHVVVTNILNQTIKIPTPLVQFTDVDVERSNGGPVTQTGEAGTIKNTGVFNGPIAETILNPGKEYSETFTLNDLYDLNKPGTYVVRVSLTGVRVHAISNLARVTITQ